MPSINSLRVSTAGNGKLSAATTTTVNPVTSSTPVSPTSHAGTFSVVTLSNNREILDESNLIVLGDATGQTLNGIMNLTLSSSGAKAGTFSKVTINNKGLVTAGTSMTSNDINDIFGFLVVGSTHPLIQSYDDDHLTTSDNKPLTTAFGDVLEITYQASVGLLTTADGTALTTGDNHLLNIF